MNEILISEMNKLGLSKYESKAYLKLIEEYPLNGYLLSKKSGIPRSKIYEVIDRLIKKEMVFEKKESENSVYYPLEPKLLISNLKKNYLDILDNIQDKTEKIYNNNNKAYETKAVIGRNKIFNMINTLISTAKKRIDISIWDEELEALLDEFKKANQRGVSIKGIYFGYNNPFKNVITHRRINTYLKEKKERYIIIIIDGKEVINGIISRGEKSQVLWSNDVASIDIVKDYIVHDVMVNVYSSKLNEIRRKEYEDELDIVRKEYFT